jgi:hypothetical protein
MSTTPRTDAQILRYRASTLCPSEEVRFEGSQVVTADFARELECENARLREALEAAWYAMERHAPQLCRREAATARQILENCGRLPILSHEPKN